jgi:alkylation response protein AidB-like acyl-CoA dehydrogenase
MDFALSQDQQMLQATAREFFQGRGLTAPARAVMAGELSVIGDLWRHMAELGFLGVTVPPAYGGAGQGMLSLVPILEEAGRALAPGPLPETLGFAVPVLAAFGSEGQRERYLGGLASGAECITVALYAAGDGEGGLVAERRGDGYRLRGSVHLVPHAAQSTTILVLAQASPGQGRSLFAVDATTPGLRLTPQAALDQTRPLYRVDFADVAVDAGARIGPEDGGAAVAEPGWLGLAEALTALAVGGMQRCVDMSAEHARTRVQFGQPIGRFQAIKHRVVDMWVDLETARSLSYYAAWSIEEGGADRVTAVADARAFASQAYVRVAAANIQNHGGMGFTWEADPHLYLKRAKSWENYAGSPAEHLEAVARSLGW